MSSKNKDTDTGFFDKLSKRLRTDKQFARIFYIGIAALLVLIIIVAAVSCGKEEETGEVQQGSPSTEAGAAADTLETSNVPDYTLPEAALEENAYADVNDIVNRYFNAVTNGDTATIKTLVDSTDEEELIKVEKESAYIDEFDNIKVYTKPGPLPNSYIAFVYYEIKFTNINTLAPALTTLYVCPKEDGSLYICDGGMTAQDTEYMQAMVEQEDVADLFTMVQTKYEEAVDADGDLSTFMAGLDAKLKAEVEEAMAMAQGTQEPEQPQEQPQEPEQPAENIVEETVKATDTVNVRSSDSENADRIGQIAMGETITRYEKKENGWSRVDYNGTEGYIKSEYLEPVETAENTQQPEASPESSEEEPEEEESAPATSITAKGSVTIKETVNVRKSASTEAEKLGVAYQGEHYELIMEQADGWCKIKFNGQTGYVKTEFVE